MADPYISLAETAALLRQDTRTPDEKALDRLLERRDALDMGNDYTRELRQVTLDLVAMLRAAGVKDPLALLVGARWPFPVAAPALDAQHRRGTGVMMRPTITVPLPGGGQLQINNPPPGLTFATNVFASTLQRSEWFGGAQEPWEDGIYEAEWPSFIKDGEVRTYFNRWGGVEGWHFGNGKLHETARWPHDPIRGRSGWPEQPLRWRGISAGQVERLRQGLEVFNG